MLIKCASDVFVSYVEKNASKHSEAFHRELRRDRITTNVSVWHKRQEASNIALSNMKPMNTKKYLLRNALSLRHKGHCLAAYQSIDSVRWQVRSQNTRIISVSAMAAVMLCAERAACQTNRARICCDCQRFRSATIPHNHMALRLENCGGAVANLLSHKDVYQRARQMATWNGNLMAAWMSAYSRVSLPTVTFRTCADLNSGL